MSDENSYIVEWANRFGTARPDAILSVSETSDNGYIVGGYWECSYKDTITIGEYTLGKYDCGPYGVYKNGIFIKYNTKGEVEYVTQFGRGSNNLEVKTVLGTSDGGYIIDGVKYDHNNQKELELKTGTSILEAKNGQYIISDSTTINIYSNGEGYKTLHMEQGINIELITSLKNGMIIIMANNKSFYKCSKKEVNNPITINSLSVGNRISSVLATSDGGYIVGGYWNGKQGDTIAIGEYTFTSGSTSSYSCSNGLLIKYSEDRKVEWATSVGGNYGAEISSISVVSDGGYIVGGYSQSYSITIGDYKLKKERI